MNLGEKIIQLLSDVEYLSRSEICRQVNDHLRKCDCKDYQNSRQKKLGQPSINTCQTKLSEVRWTITKLEGKRKVTSHRVPLTDTGQPRGWDIMSVVCLHDGTILQNLGETKFSKLNPTKKPPKLTKFM